MTAQPTTDTEPPAGAEAPVRGTPSQSPARKVVMLVVALSAFVVLITIAFAWPTVRSTPRDLPLGLVAPQAQAAQISAALDKAAPGAFALTAYADEAAARAAIGARDSYGAIVVGQKGVTVLTAPGASPAVATALEGLASGLNAQLAAQQGLTVPQLVTTQVVVPGAAGDPHGGGFATLVLPIVIGSIITGAGAALLLAGIWRRTLVVLGVAAVAGISLALVAGPWLDILGGSTWASAGVIALAVLAISGTMIGMHAVLGRPGLGLTALVVLLLGNPLSAAASAPELLPAGWSELGQWLPPGALVQALRSVAFFDGAAAGGPLMVIAGWAMVAVVLVGVGAVLGQRSPRRA